MPQEQDNVVKLFGVHSNMTPEQALDYARQNSEKFVDVLILGVLKEEYAPNPDECGNGFWFTGSKMPREWSNWIIDQAKHFVMFHQQ